MSVREVPWLFRDVSPSSRVSSFSECVLLLAALAIVFLTPARHWFSKRRSRPGSQGALIPKNARVAAVLAAATTSGRFTARRGDRAQHVGQVPGLVAPRLRRRLDVARQ